MYGKTSWLSIGVSISALVLLNAADFRTLAFPEYTGYDVRNQVTDSRGSRSVAGIPPAIRNAVTRVLLKGANEVETSSQVNRKFFKQGTEADAIADFYALKSKVVKKKSFGAVGFRGSTMFKLQLNDFYPTIWVSDPNMAKSIKIFYSKIPGQN